MRDRINLVAEYLYSSNFQKDIPLRIAITSGEFSGLDLTKNEFIELMDILLNSIKLKEDLYEFGETAFRMRETDPM